MIDVANRGEAFAEFWAERRVCTVSTLRPDGTPHVTPVGATLDAESGIVRVMCSRTSRKARNVLAAAEGTAPVSVCQVDGRRWSALEGRAAVRDDVESVAEAERRYAQRYRTPRPNAQRIVLEIRITRVLGTVR